MRLPINYNHNGDTYFKAVEFTIGTYLSIPVSKSIQNTESDVFIVNELTIEYLKFGTIIEIIFTKTDSKGYGQRFGLRMMSDFSSFIKIQDTNNQIYPTYVSASIFYNLNTFILRNKDMK